MPDLKGPSKLIENCCAFIIIIITKTKSYIAATCNGLKVSSPNLQQVCLYHQNDKFYPYQCVLNATYEQLSITKLA